mgnify:CR=1 FL=1
MSGITARGSVGGLGVAGGVLGRLRQASISLSTWGVISTGSRDDDRVESPGVEAAPGTVVDGAASGNNRRQ